MATETPTHRLELSIDQPGLLEVYTGADVTFRVAVSCPHGCDLSGFPVFVVADGKSLSATELTASGDERTAGSEVSLRAPARAGEQTWTVVVPRIDIEGLVHEGCDLSVPVKAGNHQTSLAVWDIASPVTFSSAFTIKVGAKCSALCRLAGRLVTVRDEMGAIVGEGRLGDAPWEQTEGLFWADIALIAPLQEGVAFWSVGLAAEHSPLLHVDGSAQFTFRITGLPDHCVSLRVMGTDTQSFVTDVEVRLGAYIRRTDESGRTDFDVPSGRYELTIRKEGYEAAPSTIEVDRNLDIRIDATPALTTEQWEAQLNEFKHIAWG
jgi:hypothetical protein